MIFASAYPILPLREARDAYMGCGLRDEVKPLIMGENAARFLNL